MSLDNVNLAVTIDQLDYTRYVQTIEFQDAAIGGIQYITFTLAQKLPSWVPKKAAVYVYDTRTSECVASGTLDGFGHHVSTADGDVWQITAFGPIDRLRDETRPYVAVDNQAQDGWVTFQGDSTASGHIEYNQSRPGNSSSNQQTGILIKCDQGGVFNGGIGALTTYVRFANAQAVQGRVSFTVAAGYTASGTGASGDAWTRYLYQNGVNNNDASVNAYGYTTGNKFSTTPTTYTFTYPTYDPTNKIVNSVLNYIGLDIEQHTTPYTVPDQNYWAWFGNITFRTLLYWCEDTWNTTQSAQYDTRGTSYTYEVVRDIVTRYAHRSFDTLNTFNVAASTYGVDLLAYDDGVTAEDVLNDLMTLDPAYRYTTDPPNAYSNGKFRFTWAAWPSSVRYETTLEDGGDFPLTTSDIYDNVCVLYTDQYGAQARYYATQPILNPDIASTNTYNSSAGPMAGIWRTATIDLGNELGSVANAQQAATNFLNDHAVPTNSGTITISRPVIDRLNGGLVQPWEIQAGELIRIRGIDVDSGKDALNASDSDGQSVFRVWTNTYNSDSNTATLELDSWSRTTANAISKVLQKRNRFR